MDALLIDYFRVEIGFEKKGYLIMRNLHLIIDLMDNEMKCLIIGIMDNEMK